MQVCSFLSQCYRSFKYYERKYFISKLPISIQKVNNDIKIIACNIFIQLVPQSAIFLNEVHDITHLPNDVLFNILRHLSAADQLNLHVTNRTWNVYLTQHKTRLCLKNGRRPFEMPYVLLSKMPPFHEFSRKIRNAKIDITVKCLATIILPIIPMHWAVKLLASYRDSLPAATEEDAAALSQRANEANEIWIPDVHNDLTPVPNDLTPIQYTPEYIETNRTVGFKILPPIIFTIGIIINAWNRICNAKIKYKEYKTEAFSELKSKLNIPNGLKDHDTELNRISVLYGGRIPLIPVICNNGLDNPPSRTDFALLYTLDSELDPQIEFDLETFISIQRCLKRLANLPHIRIPNFYRFNLGRNFEVPGI